MEETLKRVGDEIVVYETYFDLNQLGYKRRESDSSYVGDEGQFYYDGTSTDIEDDAVAELIDDCEPGDFLD